MRTVVTKEIVAVMAVPVTMDGISNQIVQVILAFFVLHFVILFRSCTMTSIFETVCFLNFYHIFVDSFILKSSPA